MKEKCIVRLVQLVEGEDIPWTSLQPVGNHGDIVCLCACQVTVNVPCTPTRHHQPVIIGCELVGGTPPQVALARAKVLCTRHIVYITVVTINCTVCYNMMLIFRSVFIPFTE